jgi:hypothetical protein
VIHKEWILQKHIKLFVRDAVDAPHEFFAFDRGKAAGAWSHMIERARGVRKATPDTLLRVLGFMPIWYELKWPPNKPDEDQRLMGERLAAVGDTWGWGVSVIAYWQFISECGVPLRVNAGFMAMHHNAAVLSTIARAEAKPAPKPRAGVKIRYGKRAA